jgi:23S rRNA (adenine1618-N6)-methyltransferase
MEKENNIPQEAKKGLHSRNKHRFLYDFPALIADFPELKNFVSVNKYGNESVDFADPNAVKALNKALLKHHYQIDNWDIPTDYLCPPIPGRAEYLHYIADILAEDNKGIIPRGQQIRVLDVGVGANCIYPIIGHQEYGWSFVGSETDPIALKSAQTIVAQNPALQNVVECRLQTTKNAIFKNIINENEKFDVVMSNPPFHASMEEATRGTERKLRNLGKQVEGSKPVLNFGGKSTELWCKGGEIAFITNMIFESVHFKKQCFWFSTLVSKHDNLDKIYDTLERVNAEEGTTIMIQIGNKISRIVFWTFLNKKEQAEWRG